MLNLIVAFATLVTIGTVVYLVSHHWILGAGLVVGLFLSQAVVLSLPGFTLGPINVYPHDLVFGLLGAAFVFRFLGLRRSSVAQFLWILFGTLVVVSFLRGASMFGAHSSGNDARTFFYLFSGTAYFSTFAMTSPRWSLLVRFWEMGALVLAVLALLRWGAMVLELPIVASWEGAGGGNRLRVLNAAQTLFIFQGLLLLRSRSSERTLRSGKVLAMLLLLVVIMLQHRSVWVAGFVALMLQSRARRQPLRTFYAVFITVTLGWVIWTQLGLVDSRFGQSLQHSIGEPFGEQSTIGWRIGIWEEYLRTEYLASLPDWLLGRPFGSPYISAIGAQAAYSPHNYYIHTLLRLGLAGLLLQIVALLLPHLRPHNSSVGASGGYMERHTLGLLLVTQAIFSLVYTPSYEQCLFFGSAMGLGWALRQKESVPAPSGPVAALDTAPT